MRQCGKKIGNVVKIPECPIGCHASVNKDNLNVAQSIAQSLISEYENGGGCSYSCIQSYPLCIESKCTDESTYYISQQDINAKIRGRVTNFK